MPALTAGPPSSAWVRVGPPLSAKAPSSGSVLIRSPGPARPAVFALSMLFPRDVSALLAFPPVLLSTIASNLGGGGIHAVGSGDAVLKNTILDNNVGGNSNKALTSLGNNIDSDGTALLGMRGLEEKPLFSKREHTTC